MKNYEDVVGFIEANHRNPSRHRKRWGQAPRSNFSAGARPRDKVSFRNLLLGSGPKVKF
jgi:hypothetical protein